MNIKEKKIIQFIKKGEWIAAVFIILVLGGVLWGFIKVASQPLKKLGGQIQCEEAGGIFYHGGFGADNCVFPPKSKLDIK